MCFRPVIAKKREVACPKCNAMTPLPLSIDSSMKDIMENEGGKAIIEKHCPEVLADPRFKKAMAMTLKQVKPLSGGKVTPDMIQAVTQDLAQLPKPPCKSCGEPLPDV